MLRGPRGPAVDGSGSPEEAAPQGARSTQPGAHGDPLDPRGAGSLGEGGHGASHGGGGGTEPATAVRAAAGLRCQHRCCGPTTQARRSASRRVGRSWASPQRQPPHTLPKGRHRPSVSWSQRDKLSPSGQRLPGVAVSPRPATGAVSTGNPASAALQVWGVRLEWGRSPGPGLGSSLTCLLLDKSLPPPPSLCPPWTAESKCRVGGGWPGAHTVLCTTRGPSSQRTGSLGRSRELWGASGCRVRRGCRLGLRWPGPHSRNYHTDRDPRPLSWLSGLCVPPSAPRTEVESGEAGSRVLLLREAGGPCWREHLTPPPTGKAEGSQLSTARPRPRPRASFLVVPRWA